MGKWQFLTISALLLAIYNSRDNATWLDTILVLFMIYKGINEGERRDEQ